MDKPMNTGRDFSGSTTKAALLAGMAACTIGLASVDFAFAQSGQGGSGSGNAGSEQGAGTGGQGGSDQGGQNQGGSGGHDTDAEADAPEGAGGGQPDDAGSDSGRPEDKGGQPDDAGSGGDSDSDKPDWAGEPGGSAGRGSPPDAGGGGDLYGDLYVIARDDQGVPILTCNDYGCFVQPLDAEGNPIPLDEEGHVIDESLVQEVEFGRLSVSRAPEDVLDGRSEEVLLALNSATEVSLDPAGRLVVTIDGETRTIDAPLENLSIYIALMTDGYIEGVDNTAISNSDLAFLVDGAKTAEDLQAAATFLAAATDKTGEFSTDEVAYLNLILDIDPIETFPNTEISYSAVSFDDFSYDRASTFDGVTTTILIEDADGNWVPTEIDVYEYIFADTPDDATDGTLEAFTQAAEDSRIVINYIHEYAVPVPPEEL